ncbi:hypothetical protein K504DRAFT_533087 [Pleomassaria siparia CBS 279.74]|uniref:Uncharacterized protein n=1 Tax=Pleomassaria siparia CBS 279.74 TaxID=1314801 RepID=A0A6G1KBT0_9PLEO|nr:hypothetical protein K504DRAFT_533087 [Pleomassaria siparia CBS 279.74]
MPRDEANIAGKECITISPAHFSRLQDMMPNYEDSRKSTTMVDSRASTQSQLQTLKDALEACIDIDSVEIVGLAAFLYPKNYVLCILGRHPKQSGRFVGSVYSMGGKAGARTLDVGPEVGESRLDALAKLLYRVEFEVGKMQLKDAPK